MSFAKSLLLSSILMSFSAAAGIDYWSQRSYEAEVTFPFFVEITSSKKPSEARIKKDIGLQMKGLIYPLDEKGISQKGNFDVTITDIASADGIYTAKYVLKTRFQIPHNQSSTFSMDLIHSPGEVMRKLAGGNPCGTYTGSDFWVYWSPRSSACPLREGVDFTNVTVKATPIKNTEKSFPEFEKMIKGGNVLIALFIGNDSPHSISYLQSKIQGYQRRDWTPEEIYTIAPRDSSQVPRIAEFTKASPQGTITIRVFDGYTDGNSSTTRAFRYFYKDAVENAAFVGYSGHAGLGKNLNFEAHERIEGFTIVPHSGYQIYLVNACFPYQYYTEQFFARKKTSADPEGSKMLDVVTSEGQIWSDMGLTVRFVQAIDAYMDSRKLTSYQELLSGHYPAHAVDGDHDNHLR